MRRSLVCSIAQCQTSAPSGQNYLKTSERLISTHVSLPGKRLSHIGRVFPFKIYIIGLNILGLNTLFKVTHGKLIWLLKSVILFEFIVERQL